MKPILVPILDINYYLPHFSGKFDINQLFKKSEEKKHYGLENIRTRVEKLGGTVEISGKGGTTIAITIKNIVR